MRKIIAILVLAAGLAACGAISTLVDGFKFAKAVENDAASQGASQSAAQLFDLSDETFLRIAVEDSGIGIPSDKVAKIFERFFQVDNSSTREFGGTGLGLSIVKSFVEAHNGLVKVESEQGRGSRFTVLLPLE